MNNILKFVIILILLFVISSFLVNRIIPFGNKMDLLKNKIAVIKIGGPISTTGSTFLQKGTSSESVLSYIETAKKDKSVKAVLFEINSPGGTVVASSEIASAIKKLDKPTTAFIKDTGTSGAYWIASAADTIVANPLSIIGSIGVLGSYLEFSDLMEEYGITYQRLVSGKYKDIGSPYKELTPMEKNLIQKRLDQIHSYFIKEVSANRDIDVSNFAEGMFYLGTEAKDIGLVDYLGDKDLAVNLTKQNAGITKAALFVFEERKTLFGLIRELFSSFSYYIGRGIGSEVFQSSFEIKV